jgi:hypothetical protein
MGRLPMLFAMVFHRGYLQVVAMPLSTAEIYNTIIDIRRLTISTLYCKVSIRFDLFNPTD